MISISTFILIILYTYAFEFIRNLVYYKTLTSIMKYQHALSRITHECRVEGGIPSIAALNPPVESSHVVAEEIVPE